MECKPQGSPKPTISWKKGDKAVRENKRLEVYFIFQILKIDHPDSVTYVLERYVECPHTMVEQELIIYRKKYSIQKPEEQETQTSH